MIKFSEKNVKILFATAGFCILLSLIFINKNPFYLNLIFTIFMFAGLSSAWNIIGGFAGQLSLGHSAFYGLGAYATSILFVKCGIPPIFGIWISALLAVFVALIIGFPCFRLKGPFFTLATIAIGEVFLIIAVNFKELTAGSEGLTIPFNPSIFNLSFHSKTPYAIVGLLFMLLAIGTSSLIHRRRLGYELAALRDEDQAAESLGVNTTKAKIMALTISAVLTTIGGGIYAQYILFLEPHSEFSLATSVNFAMISMVGGLGTVLGPVIGAFILIPLQEILRAWLGGISQGLYFVIYGVLLILVVMFVPRGILQFCTIPINKIMKRISSPEMPGIPVETNLTHFSIKDLLAGTDQKENLGEKEVILKIDSISKRFGGVLAVDKVSLSVKRKEIFGIIGPNGAGKSTFFNILSGVYAPDSGQIFYNDKLVSAINKSHRICRLGIGRTFQIVKPFENMTVLENVMVGSFCHCKDSNTARALALEILSITGLLGKKDQYGHALTLADKKRLEMARALATRPTILLLDEVMAGLTPSEVEEAISLIKAIRDSGITVLVVEHVMHAIMSLSDRVMVMSEGKKIAEGIPSDIISNPEVIKAYLGDEYANTSA